MSENQYNQPSRQPILVLTCQRDSHPFEERVITLNEVVKVGRAVARVKSTSSNAIFDCKVLSRSHALIWYKGERFWLRDTNSSNGTFVNSTKVVKRGDEEFAEREIFSGDVIRFGVDVVEHDTTHGCIIAQVTLYHPNGTEAKQNSQPVNTSNGLTGIENLQIEQTYRLTHYINEALFREQVLDAKFENVKQLLETTQEISEANWQAMLNEERLLEKLNLYEDQLSVLKTDLPESSLQSQLIHLLEDKSELEKASKIMLERLLIEKTELLSKASHLEHYVSDLKKECDHLRQSLEISHEAYQTLASDRQAKLMVAKQTEKEDVKQESSDLSSFQIQSSNHESKPDSISIINNNNNNNINNNNKDYSADQINCYLGANSSFPDEKRLMESSLLVNGIDKVLDPKALIERLKDHNLDDSCVLAGIARLLNETSTVLVLLSEPDTNADSFVNCSPDLPISETTYVTHFNSQPPPHDLTSTDDYTSSSNGTLTNQLLQLKDDLQVALTESETYKQLNRTLQQQDHANTELLSSVREECNRLKSRIALVESDVASSRKDHQQLIIETKRCQQELNGVKKERDRLSSELQSANQQVEYLKSLLNPTKNDIINNHHHLKRTDADADGDSISVNDSSSINVSSVQMINNTTHEQLLTPNHIYESRSALITTDFSLTLFAVIPVMVIICAFMIYIFLKFSR